MLGAGIKELIDTGSRRRIPHNQVVVSAARVRDVHASMAAGNMGSAESAASGQAEAYGATLCAASAAASISLQ